jgi:hypothetical protein
MTSGSDSRTIALREPQTFASLIVRGASPAEIANHLDGLELERRVREVRAIGRRLQVKLWGLVKGAGALEIASFVGEPERTAIFKGRNTVPIFSTFEKRFWRPASGDVFGYNHNVGLAALPGPGYFMVAEAEGELVFDYCSVPRSAPSEWPPVRPNSGFLAGIVYGGMQDYVRFVSKTTVIGAAFRRGKPRNFYFLLTRFA